jgi:dTDP-glucose 4,6-dehydratase
MTTKRVLVNGGCGFFGSNFIRHLLTNDPDHRPSPLLNVDARTYTGNPATLADLAEDPLYRFESADIADEEKLLRLLRENETLTITALADQDVTGLQDAGLLRPIAGMHGLKFVSHLAR